MPLLVLAGVLLVAYGFEIFSFSLTMDEPVLGQRGQLGLFESWTAGGRWGMGLVSLVMPPMVVPSLATFVGVCLTAAGVWFLAREVFRLGPWLSAGLTALCVSLPMILLHLSFMTNAAGIGVGFLMSSVIAYRVGRQRGAVDVTAVAMSTFVLGVYEAFALVLFSMALGMIAVRPKPELIRRWLGLLLISVVASKVIGKGLQYALGVSESDYSSSMLDLGGLAEGPWDRVSTGAARAYSVLAPGGQVFDRGSPWLALALVLLAGLAIAGVAAQRGSPGQVAIRWAALVALLAVPLAGAVLVVEIPLRSMLYLPPIIVSLAAVASSCAPESMVRAFRWPAVTVLALAVVANISVGNSALASAELALGRDRHMAMRIDEERRRLLPHLDDPVKIYVKPVLRWPDSSLTPGLEHLGLSLFSGETWRAKTFLESQGLRVAALSPAQEAAAVQSVATMPAYPLDGWVEVHGDVLVVKLQE